MLCLSVQQPWAFLLVNGVKNCENRVWRTEYRGPLLIHAGRKMDEDGFDYAAGMQSRGYDVWLPRREEFVTGAVVGLVQLTDCTRTRSSAWHAPKQWGWYMRDAIAFEVPTFMPGQLKLFDVPVETLRLYTAAELKAVA